MANENSQNDKILMDLKILTELQIPKEHKKLILDKGITNREEIITSLLAENSFTVEINTAKNSKFVDKEDIYYMPNANGDYDIIAYNGYKWFFNGKPVQFINEITNHDNTTK